VSLEYVILLFLYPLPSLLSASCMGIHDAQKRVEEEEKE